MRLELEYHNEDQRWYWRVYEPSGFDPTHKLVREGVGRTVVEAKTAAVSAAGEYKSRKVMEL